ncbi:MAG TPA: AI-2E family transporter [Verrucomicrobiae bacterium]|nr:AI-2E family transporter [Verrucomicrobiae bacterium]
MNDLGDVASSAPAAAPRARLPTLRHDIAAWILTGAGLLMALRLGLLPALFAGLLMHELVHILTPPLRLRRFGPEVAKTVAVIVLALIIGSLIALAVSGLMASVRSGYDSLPELMRRMAEIIEARRDSWPSWLVNTLPADAPAMQAAAVEWLRGNAGSLQMLGVNAGRALTYVLFGMIIGAFVALRRGRPAKELGPLARSLSVRITRLGSAFRRVVFAQVRISAINTFFTWCYLGIALPAFGIELPLTKTLIAVTFLCGLLPVLGNIISNTVITVVSLSHSWELATASLGYLVVIHKLEYFLNARIIGSQIQARAWEMLIAMLAMEAAFGIAGLIAAPVYYAYLKRELTARKLI